MHPILSFAFNARLVPSEHFLNLTFNPHFNLLCTAPIWFVEGLLLTREMVPSEHFHLIFNIIIKPVRRRHN